MQLLKLSCVNNLKLWEENSLKTFSSLSPEELCLKPAPDRWSIAQCIEHVIQTNESYYPIFDKLNKGTYEAPFTATVPFLPELFGWMLKKSMNPSRKFKAKTMDVFEPSEAGDSTILTKVPKHVLEFEQRLESVPDALLRKQKIHSPASPKVTYSLKDALKIIALHAHRHHNQAVEVQEQIMSDK